MVEPGALISLAEHRRRKLGTAGKVAGDGASAADHSKPSRPIGLALFVLLVLSLGIVVAALTGTPRMTSVHELPPGLRSAMYRGTLWEVRDVCGTSSAAAGVLREHCIGQARFLSGFPECDAECRQLAHRIVLTRHR